MKAIHFDRPLTAALLEAAMSGVIALLVLLPISGFTLEGYRVQANFVEPMILAALTMVARFTMLVAARHPSISRVLSGKSRQDTAAVATSEDQRKAAIVLIAFLAAGLAAPFFVSGYWMANLILALIYVLLGLGLNVVVGFAGLLDLGYVAFYAIGAYSLALGSHFLGIGFWLALPIAAVVAAVAGAILGTPVLRMHGDYLAVVTLGFGEIIRLILNNWGEFTGGPNGMDAPGPTLFGLEFTRQATPGQQTFHDAFGLAYSNSAKYVFIYLILLACVILAIVAVNRLRFSPIGRAWEALREDQTACRSLGINHVVVKLSAFMIGATTGGVAGVFFATYQGFVNPASFTFIESALILAIVVLGGMGSVSGVVISAFVLTIAPEILRDFSDYRMIAFGLLMVVIMTWRPRGLVRIKRPMHAAPAVPHD